jgi:pyruvate kinase
MAMFRDVYPVAHEPEGEDMEQGLQEVLQILWNRGSIAAGDRVILTMGDRKGNRGGTNTMRLVQIGQGGFPEQQSELANVPMVAMVK